MPPTLPTFPSVPHRFRLETTTEEVLDFYKLDLSGRNAIVTGGYSGIGIETVKALLSLGVNIVVPARSVEKAEAVLQEIRKSVGEAAKGAKLQAEYLDLSSFESIRAFAKKYNEREIPLHYFIGNAGAMGWAQRELTADGIESTIGVNHFGHFLLTNLLLPSLRRGAPSRVVILSSLAHAGFFKDFEDINFDKDYQKYAAYGRSKFANLAFAKHFNKLHQKEGITANAVHPGSIATDLTRNLGQEEMDALSSGVLKDMFWKTPSQGAATTIYVVISPELEGIGGQYFEDVYFVTKWFQDGQFEGTIPQAFDEELHKKIWDISVELTKFDEQQQ